jgi:hypothetical protein
VSEQDEWGPWIEHDGRGCPCEGMYTQDAVADGSVIEGLVGNVTNPPKGCYSLWVWDSIPSHRFHRRVIRYRVRKPRGMAVLEQALQAKEVDA